MKASVSARFFAALRMTHPWHLPRRSPHPCPHLVCPGASQLPKRRCTSGSMAKLVNFTARIAKAHVEARRMRPAKTPRATVARQVGNRRKEGPAGDIRAVAHQRGEAVAQVLAGRVIIGVDRLFTQQIGRLGRWSRWPGGSSCRNRSCRLPRVLGVGSYPGAHRWRSYRGRSRVSGPNS